MTFDIKTDEGESIGTAETLGYKLRRPEIAPCGPGSTRINTVQSNPESVVIGGYRPTEQVESLKYKARYAENDRDFYRELFDRVVDQRDEHAAVAEARGKTIHELTEKFREKKERIHAFYSPQLENRKAENEELEYWKRYAKVETEQANYWYIKYREAVSSAAQPAPSIHDSVIQEHEEQVGKLSRERDQWRDSHRAACERNVEWAGENQDLRGELAVVKAERDRLLTRINCFMEEFGEAVTQINNAVEDWNDEEEDA